MDLIAIDESFNERFIFKNYNSDFAVGEENTFEVSIHLNDYSKLNEIKYLSVDDTEFGGIINSFEIDTESKTVSVEGSTWRGMLADRIICPAENTDYFTASGKPEEIMQQIITSAGLNKLFSVTSSAHEKSISYQFNRYCSLLDGFEAMLKSIGYILTVKYDNGRVYLSGEALKTVEVIDNYDCKLSISKCIRPYNHLICLGQGELKDRDVIHLYLDENGTIGKTQCYFGFDERTSVYDYPNVEDVEALEEYGIQRFEELLESENISAALSNADLNIGHYIQAYEHNTGTSIKKKISKIILTLTNGKGIINYEVNG